VDVLESRGVKVEIPVESVGPGATVVAHVFSPDPLIAATLPAPVWIFTIHGAGEDWTYFDKVIPGHEDEPYSFAEFMAAKGIGTVAIDALGCGESVYPYDGSQLTLDVIGQGHAQASDVVRAGLADGSLAEGLPPQPNLYFIGLGHSGGGGVVMVQQASHSSYDGIVVLSMPADDFKYPNAGQKALDSAIHYNEKGMIYIPKRPSQSINGAFTPDTPQDVRDAFPPGKPFPASHLLNMKNGTLSVYAEKITCPVFSGFGEVDLAGSPLQEQNRFGSKDTTSYVQSGCYHHVWASPAPARLEFMAVISNWARSRAAAARTA
jgi:alpha-beta hydrolase superfamily lysophospholipase